MSQLWMKTTQFSGCFFPHSLRWVLRVCVVGSRGPPGLRVAVGQRGVAAASIQTPASNPKPRLRGLYVANTHTHTHAELSML